MQCNTLFAIAAILDPRKKMGMIKFTFPSLYGQDELPVKLEKVESTLNALYASYESEYNKTKSTSKENDAASQHTSTSAGTSSSVISAASEWEKFVKAQNATNPSKSDLRKYLDDPVEVIPLENFSVLFWWRMNEMKYPVVARLANKLDQGSNGTVYKAVLPGGNEVAAKRLFLNTRQCIDQFFNEIDVISQVRHKNLVKLLGCSVDGPGSFLIYEYQFNSVTPRCLVLLILCISIFEQRGACIA